VAIEYTLKCDGCGEPICASSRSAKDARAKAQLDHRAYCGVGDWCRKCRTDRATLSAADRERAAAAAHSCGTMMRRD
jgi:hypothetical protein